MHTVELERKAEFSQTIYKFLRYLQSVEQLELDTKVQALEKEYGTAQREYFRAFGQWADKKRRLEEIQHSIRNNHMDFEKNFETILNIAGVRKIECGSSNRLSVFTNPLTQTLEDGRTFDIGQYVIIVSYIASPPYTKRCVYFRKGPYVGAFDHQNAKTDGETCFGINQHMGLNNMVDKLVGDFEIPSLIHLIMAFLERDIDSPTTRTIGEDKGKIDTTGYASEDEKQTQKLQFVLFCHDCLDKIKTLNVEKELADLRKKRDEAREAGITIRANIKVASEMSKTIRNVDRDTLEKRANEEATLLEAEKKIIRIETDRNVLRIHFVEYETRLILEIAHHEPPRIKTSNGNDPETFSNVLTAYGFIKADTGFIDMMARLMDEKGIYAIFQSVVGILNRTPGEKGGWYDI